MIKLETAIGFIGFLNILILVLGYIYYYYNTSSHKESAVKTTMLAGCFTFCLLWFYFMYLILLALVKYVGA